MTVESKFGGRDFPGTFPKTGITSACNRPLTCALIAKAECDLIVEFGIGAALPVRGG